MYSSVREDGIFRATEKISVIRAQRLLTCFLLHHCSMLIKFSAKDEYQKYHPNWTELRPWKNESHRWGHSYDREIYFEREMWLLVIRAVFIDKFPKFPLRQTF